MGKWCVFDGNIWKNMMKHDIGCSFCLTWNFSSCGLGFFCWGGKQKHKKFLMELVWHLMLIPIPWNHYATSQHWRVCHQRLISTRRKIRTVCAPCSSAGFASAASSTNPKALLAARGRTKPSGAIDGYNWQNHCLLCLWGHVYSVYVYIYIYIVL